ncbi:MAG: LysR family transcriptional regulator ArgP [Acinetobacter sp.]
MLNHKQCEAFLAVAETGSFDLAAARLHITASAVTLRVQSLEKHLGQMLIVRERPCKATAAGISLLHYLQHSRLLEQNFIQSLTGQSSGNFYQVSIATNADSLATWLLPALQPALTAGKITIHFQVDDQSQTHHLLEAGLVNACVAQEPKAMKGCTAQYLGSMTYRFVSTPHFAETYFAKGINRETLRTAPALIFNAKDQMHTSRIQQEYGLSPEQYPHFFVPSSSAFMDAVLMGLGYGWLPDYQAAVHLQEGKLTELSEKLRLEQPLYWHHWKQQSDALNRLSAILQSQAGKIMNGTFQADS